jgi:hypothetical protein
VVSIPASYSINLGLKCSTEKRLSSFMFPRFSHTHRATTRMVSQIRLNHYSTIQGYIVKSYGVTLHKFEWMNKRYIHIYMHKSWTGDRKIKILDLMVTKSPGMWSAHSLSPLSPSPQRMNLRCFNLQSFPNKLIFVSGAHTASTFKIPHAMKTVCSFETLVPACQTTWSNNLEDQVNISVSIEICM